MTAASSSTIESFLKSTRNRLWLQAILALLLRGTWWASAIALCGGFVHVFFYPLAWSLFMALILVPVATTLVWGLFFNKPSLQTAAATADNWFSSKSLMSTALDQLDLPAEQLSRAGQFVILQAEKAASTWQTKVANGHRLRIPRQIVVPLSFIIMGSFLLILPQQSKETRPTFSSENNGIKPGTQHRPASNLIADLQLALHTSEAEKHSRKADKHASQNATPILNALNRKISSEQDQNLRPNNNMQFVAVPIPGDNQGPATRSTDLAATNSSQLSFPTHPDKKKSTAPGTLADPMENPKTVPQTTDLDIEFFDITVPQPINNEANTGPGKNIELNLMQTKTDRNPNTHSVAAANQSFSMPYEMTLSPAQKRYMARYFKSFGETP